MWKSTCDCSSLLMQFSWFCYISPYATNRLDCLKHYNQADPNLEEKKKQRDELHQISISCRATALQGVLYFVQHIYISEQQVGSLNIMHIIDALISHVNSDTDYDTDLWYILSTLPLPYLQCPVIYRRKMEVRCVAQWDVETGRICPFVLFGTGGTATLPPHCFHCSPSLQTPPNKTKTKCERK